jgi:hypothetical protein
MAKGADGWMPTGVAGKGGPSQTATTQVELTTPVPRKPPASIDIGQYEQRECPREGRTELHWRRNTHTGFEQEKCVTLRSHPGDDHQR